jgi:hypothetical protein
MHPGASLVNENPSRGTAGNSLADRPSAASAGAPAISDGPYALRSVSVQRLGVQLRREAPSAATVCWAGTDRRRRLTHRCYDSGQVGGPLR